MESTPTILLVEDEAPIRRFLRTALSSHSYRLLEATTANEGLTQSATHPPDAILLDLGLPDMDGLEFIRRIREWSQVPIIILSARGQEKDKVAGLDAGADDYLTKPFGIPELLARLRVALRHGSRVSEDGETVFESNGLKVDLVRRQVFVNDAEIHLTPIEFKLLVLCQS